MSTDAVPDVRDGIQLPADDVDSTTGRVNGHSRAPSELDRLRVTVSDVCASAVDALEIAAVLEADGLSEQAVRERFGFSSVFLLAEELYRQVPRQPAEPEPTPDPWRVNRLRHVLHGVLYGLPAVGFPAVTPLLHGRAGTALLVTAMLLSWALSQGLAYLGYSRLSRGDQGGSATVLLGGLAIGLLVLSSAVAAAGILLGVPTPVILFGAGQGWYLLGATVLLVGGSERRLLLALAPGVLGGASYLALGRPMSLAAVVWLALAASAVLSVVLAIVDTSRPPSSPWTLSTAEIRGALPHAVFGLLAAGLLAFPVVGIADQGRPVAVAVTLAALPLSLSMGAAEWSLYWYRQRVWRVVQRTGDLGRFAVQARLALVFAGLRYLLALVVLMASTMAAGWLTGLIDPQWTVVLVGVAYLALGGALFVALLLQALNSGPWTLIACGAALALEIEMVLPADGAPIGDVVSAQLVACTVLLGALLFRANAVVCRASRQF